jgi:cysteine sulfinate desulfinase/cysteine desulfurase-like protein
MCHPKSSLFWGDWVNSIAVEVRFTIGRHTTEGDIEKLLDVMPPIVERLRSTYNPYL